MYSQLVDDDVMCGQVTSTACFVKTNVDMFHYCERCGFVVE